MADPYSIYRPLLDLLGKSEGTDRGRGYNETLAYGAYTGGDVDLVNMTLDQVDALQTAMLAHPDNRWNSSAVGRYQVVRTTLRKIRKALNLSGSDLYDEALQDKCACYLLGGRGIDRWLGGMVGRDTLINNLAKEWASLPTVEDVGFYGGQRAAVSVAEVRRVLEEVNRRAVQHTGLPAPTPKPVQGQAVKAVKAVAAGAAASAGVGAVIIQQDQDQDQGQGQGLGIGQDLGAILVVLSLTVLVVAGLWIFRRPIVSFFKQLGDRL